MKHSRIGRVEVRAQQRDLFALVLRSEPSRSVAQVNCYLADYLARHSLGGTVTKQGNLRVFLKHLAEEYGGADLWADPKRHRYQRQEEHPAVLAPGLIAALL